MAQSTYVMTSYVAVCPPTQLSKWIGKSHLGCQKYRELWQKYIGFTSKIKKIMMLYHINATLSHTRSSSSRSRGTLTENSKKNTDIFSLREFAFFIFQRTVNIWAHYMNGGCGLLLLFGVMIHLVCLCNIWHSNILLPDIKRLLYAVAVTLNADTHIYV